MYPSSVARIGMCYHEAVFRGNDPDYIGHGGGGRGLRMNYRSRGDNSRTRRYRGRRGRLRQSKGAARRYPPHPQMNNLAVNVIDAPIACHWLLLTIGPRIHINSNCVFPGHAGWLR